MKFGWMKILPFLMAVLLFGLALALYDEVVVGTADADANDEDLLHAGLVAPIQSPVRARRVVEKASRAEKATMPTATKQYPRCIDVPPSSTGKMQGDSHAR